MNDLSAWKEGRIRVARITLGHLSRGLYRSVGSAFKELVSNAYDADATVVRIDTNYPEFNYMSCVDNGSGMSLEEFKRFFKDQGIGTCVKRKNKEDKTGKYKRPIIGRLGIGMLAIGQLCHSFKIESHYIDDKDGKGKAYRAEIVLADVFPFPDMEQVLRDADIKDDEVDVGIWKYKPIEYIDRRQGLRIYSSDVRTTFMREMKSSVEEEMTEKERKKISFRQSDLHSRFYAKSRSVRESKAYLETIWELAILCPLPYYGKIEEHPIDSSSFPSEETRSDDFKQVMQFLKNRQSKLIGYNFRLLFDGIELRRYIQLPTEEDTIPKVYFLNFDDTVFESRLRFSGYLFAQIPRYIKPLELNGVQVRLRNVGIGGYDATYLKYYAKVPTIRTKWVSGEIFVDEGLESALNIDRDSFNEHDEHYKKLQLCLHERLRTVFPEIVTIAKKRSEAKRDAKDEELKKSMRTIVAEQSGRRFKLLQRDLEKDGPIVTVNEDKGEIVLNTASRPLKKKKADMIIRHIMLAYHTAKRTAKTEEERDKQFYQLVKDILDKLV